MITYHIDVATAHVYISDLKKIIVRVENNFKVLFYVCTSKIKEREETFLAHPFLLIIMSRYLEAQLFSTVNMPPA